jgi:hypothetical protein
MENEDGMSNEDNYLLHWVFRAIDACRAEGVRPDTLTSETLWKNLGAPDWVLPAMREARQRLTDGERS